VSRSFEAGRNSLPSRRAGPFSPPESSCFAANKAGIQLRFDFVDQQVDAKSVLSLMLLEAVGGTELIIKANGEDEV